MPRGNFEFRSKVARLWAKMAIIMFFAWGSWALCYTVTRPRVTDPASGRVYSFKMNGRSAFLTSTERNILRGLCVCAAVFLFNAVIIESIARRNYDPRKFDVLKLK
jgi:hypothetical protein